MKPKKLSKHWKSGEVWEKGVLYCVRKLRKKFLSERTCRFQKHKYEERREYE